MKDKLYSELVCALTHDIEVCDACKKCKGKNGAEIRMNLVRELTKIFDKQLPWVDTEPKE